MKSTESVPNIARKLSSDVISLKNNAKLLDQQFQAEKEAKESKFFSRVSSVLISVWQLKEILVKLSAGESVIIDSDGNLYKGRVKLEKYQKLYKKLPGKNDTAFDNGTHEYLATKSWITSPGNPLKNSWESIALKAPELSSHPVIQLFEDKLSSCFKEGTTAFDPEIVTKNFVTNNNGKFVEISIKDYPVSVGISMTTQKIRYYIYKGQITDI